jgi:hypothetical protein
MVHGIKSLAKVADPDPTKRPVGGKFTISNRTIIDEAQNVN